MTTVSDLEKSAGKRDTTEPPQPAIYPGAIAPSRIDADAAKVLRRLTRHGHAAYLVGGGVRDLLLGRRPKDFDIATSARPQEVRRLFRNSRIIGRRFRLVHVLFAEGKIVEVATFRRDPGQRYKIEELPILPELEPAGDEPPIRLVPLASPRVQAGADLLIRSDNVFGAAHEDAIRRDFTINGLFYDLDHGEVIDYVGGVPDIHHRTLSVIGDPDVRFREDPVRILRAIKFSARLDLGIEPAVYDAILEHRADLSRAAPPRMLEEVFRLMRGGAAHRSIYLAWDLGVLAIMLPELACFLDDRAAGADFTWGRLATIDAWVAQGKLPGDAVLLAALLLGPIEEAIEGVSRAPEAFEEFFFGVTQRLAVPRRVKDRVRLLISSQRRLRAGQVSALSRREFFGDALALFKLDCAARGKSVPAWGEQALATASDAQPGRRRRRRRRSR